MPPRGPRRRNRRRGGEQESPPVHHNPFNNVRGRNSSHLPRNAPPGVQPSYDPFRPSNNNFRSNANRPREPRSHSHRASYSTVSQRLAARDRALFQADWKLRQRHLKQQLVRTLHLAVQTIELWLPETAPFEDFYENDEGSEASDETVDEMEWQLEKEIVIPDPPETRYTWGGGSNFVPRGNGASQFVFPTTPPYSPGNTMARQRDEQASSWSL